MGSHYRQSLELLIKVLLLLYEVLERLTLK